MERGTEMVGRRTEGQSEDSGDAEEGEVVEEVHFEVIVFRQNKNVLSLSSARTGKGEK